jgi:hypothetical protein
LGSKIRDLGVKKAPDPGSGSATLLLNVEDLVELDLGHVTGTTPVRKGMELDRARLQAYLATVLGSSIFTLSGCSGSQSDTVLIQIGFTLDMDVK